jgi:hypothetical protein
MIQTQSPRAARSHCFDIAYFCTFCRRPLRYFAEHGFGYCSSAWTGRPERGAHAYWRFGPIMWRRVGVVAIFNVGPLAIVIVGDRWRLGLI